METNYRAEKHNFSDVLLLWKFFAGMTQKVVFHLLSDQIFLNLSVKGKQPGPGSLKDG